MTNQNKREPAYRNNATTLFSNLPRKALYLSLGAMLVAAVAGCSSPERSRSLGDPNVPARTLALQVCSNCHGVQGVSESPNFPDLAGQSKPYLIAQLKMFKSHGRSDPAGFEYMWGISSRLTDQQIDGLATYFSSQSPPPGKLGNPELIKEGEAIFKHGIPASNTPACFACHGPKAAGTDQFPRLAGQHADYIMKQLMVFQRTNQRPDGNAMKIVAHSLTPRNAKSVAAYLQALPALGG